MSAPRDDERRRRIAAAGGVTSIGAGYGISQAAHGFVTGDAIYFNGTVWAKARADAEATLGIAIADVINSGAFYAVQTGLVTGLSSLTPGAVYYVSAATAGLLTSTSPSAEGQFSNPLLVATSATEGIVLPFRPSDVVGNSFASLILGKASNEGIKVDLAAPTYGWHDIIGGIYPKTTGAGTPALAQYRAAGNIYQFAFIANDVVDFVFHVPHDYVVGSDLHIHVHWSHTGTTIVGNATFQMYLTYAKGHNQANFPVEVNPVVTYATTDIATTPQYRHRVDEVQASTAGGSATQLNTTNIEVDGLIVGRCVLTSLPTIGGGGKLFIHTIDLHYQSTGLPTKQKSPGFYT